MTNELTTALTALPVFSARVLRTLLDGLYAEPGYSDVIAEDIASALNVSGKAVGGALSHLTDSGLVQAYITRVNSAKVTFLHVHESGPLTLHDYEGTREKAIALLDRVIGGTLEKAVEAPKASKRDAIIAEAKAEEAITEPKTITLRFRAAVDEMLQLDEQSMYYSEFEISHRSKQVVVVLASVRAAEAMLEDCRDRSTSTGGYDQPMAWYRVAKAAVKVLEAALAAPAPAVKKARKSADDLDLAAEKLEYKRSQWRKWNKMYRERKKALAAKVVRKTTTKQVAAKAKKAVAKKGGRKATRRTSK